MQKIEELKAKIAAFKTDNDSKDFLEFVVATYKDSIIEICISLQYEQVIKDQTTTPIYATIYGKVIDCVNGFLVLNAFANNNNNLSTNNIMFINRTEIVALQPYSNECSLPDTFLKYGSKIFNCIKE